MKGKKTSDLDFTSFGDLIELEEIVLTEENGFLKQTSQEVEKISTRKRKKKRNSVGNIIHKKPKVISKKNDRNINFDVNKNLTFLDNMKSWSSFGIHNEILLALHEKKYFEPTKIQLKCLGPAICGHLDILGAAETGSGKTLAFGIPIVNGILSMKENDVFQSNDCEDLESNADEKNLENIEGTSSCIKIRNIKLKNEKNKLYALILTPTRELAVQVKDHLLDICKYTNIHVALVVGGLAYEKQERILQKRPEIIVATPGRLWELINDRNIHLQSLQSIRYLAIDETDRMLEKGHFAELSALLERINSNEIQKKKRQNFVFSATLTVVHSPPAYLKGKKKKRITPAQKLQELIVKIGITNPKIIDITNTQVTAENLLEFKIFCEFEEKDYYLFQCLKSRNGRSIVFCNSIGCVKRLANLLNILNLKPLPLHANMEQKQRLRNLDKFRANENALLLATDVAARGLDIPNVDLVIHYQVPKTAEIYVHRSGRTARANSMGNALLLVEPKESNSYKKLLHTLGRNKDVEDFKLDMNTFKHIKKVIHLARDIDQLTLALKKENSRSSWYEKAIKELDIIVDEDELPKRRSIEADVKIKRDLNFKKKELNSLLSKPLIPQNFSYKFPDINFNSHDPMTYIRRDKLNIPGAFVLRNVPSVL